MQCHRTPDDAFADLPGHPYAPPYAEFEGMRLHYADKGEEIASHVLDWTTA